jgi:hypothetical protein
MARPFDDHGPLKPQASFRAPEEALREQLYGPDSGSVVAPGSGRMVFTYASPKALAQARREAMQARLSARMNAMMGADPHLETDDANDQHMPHGQHHASQVQTTHLLHSSHATDDRYEKTQHEPCDVLHAGLR